MSISTYIDQAETRVKIERDAVTARVDAFESFIDRVADLPTDSTPSAVSGTVTAGPQLQVNSSADDGCRQVCTAFAETVRPHSVTDVDGPEPLLETVREELTDTIAVALAPATDASFTPELKQTIISEARTRQGEANASREALEREEANLGRAGAAVDEIATWIVEANETPLTDLGFDTLRQRHEALAGHRDRCTELVRERQTFLQGTTNDGIGVGLRNRSLIQYLYQELSVDHPVLSTVATLDSTCMECQQTVRDHLIRRA
jgi:hypothetical protein